MNKVIESSMKVPSTYGVSNLMQGVNERNTAAGLNAYLNDFVGPQAAFSTVVSDLNQGLKATFPQLVVGALEGKDSLSRMLGLQDTEDKLKESFGTLGAQAASGPMLKSGVGVAALTSAEDLTKKAGSGKLTDKDIATSRAALSDQIDKANASKDGKPGAGIDKDAVLRSFDQTAKSAMAHSSAVGHVSKGQIAKAEKELKATALTDKLHKREEDKQWANINEELGDKDVQDNGGLFAADLQGWFHGSQESKLVSTILGKDASGGNENANLRKIAMMSSSDIRAMPLEKQRAVAELHHMAMAKQERQQESDEHQARQGKGAKITGTLTIVDNYGRRMTGQLDGKTSQ